MPAASARIHARPLGVAHRPRERLVKRDPSETLAHRLIGHLANKPGLRGLRSVHRNRVAARRPLRKPLRVAFLYNAQNHQLLHSLPVACELSRLSDMTVVVLARTQEQLELARQLARFYPENRLVYEMLCPAPPIARRFRSDSKSIKKAALLVNLFRFNSFDALVVPERTSVKLQKYGVTRPKYIHSFHGASGHDRVADERLGKFDLLLAPSARRLERIVAVTGAQPRRAAVIGYAKLDLVRRMAKSRVRLLKNDRPTILYNPHHWPDKSSWHILGRRILEHFKENQVFNLIFAPHVRLFDPPDRQASEFAEFLALEHMLVDLGSERSIDMTYTIAADIYLGDVSSQVFEFVLHPRPCIFLNPRGLEWSDDPDFASWKLGRVVGDLQELDAALATLALWQPQYESVQRDATVTNFPELGTPAPLRGALAIASFLQGRAQAWMGRLGAVAG
jgi:hypothetical protein